MSILKIKRALVSVSDKTGAVALAGRLAASGVELVSTGGTAAALRDAGLAVRDVSAITGYPEMMGGRVKTLHPAIHGGILALRDDPEHVRAMQENGVAPFDLLAVNLYPFSETVASGADFDRCIENIDIGGPAMIRAAAKNHAHVCILTDTADYAPILEEIESAGGVGLETRRRLAADAFARTAAYDAAIAGYLAREAGRPFPQQYVLAGQLAQTLRYGENPHQAAAFYRSDDIREGVATAVQRQGKGLSYNNLNDTNAAFELVAEIGAARPAVAIIKHANPCGAAVGDTLGEAYDLALRCDPVSAFGGVVALSRPMTTDVAERLVEVFTEVVIAPGADDAALAILERKKNMRVLLTAGLPDPGAPGFRLAPLAGGFLVQSRDNHPVDANAFRVVTKTAPTERELADLVFAFRVAKHVKSNAIVYARDGATVGVGAGQMSRVDSCVIAARKAAEAAKACHAPESLAIGSVVASDAFFPFADGLLAAIEAGATAVAQPGGSIRDEEVVAAADEAGVAMVFTGARHFYH